jgi:2-dehydropantoate 2-reductase
VNLADPIIAIIGSGAVGGYYGARLIQHGHRVHMLSASDCDHIRKFGMTIESRDGDFSLRPDQVNVYDDPRQMPKADLVVVTLKTTANHRFSELVGPVVKDGSLILTLQNGLGNEELLGSLFGSSRILGGNAFVCINRIGPGKISHTDHGMIRIGEPAGGTSERAQKIADLFSQSGVPCSVLENLTFGKWDKLVWNIPFNGLGAALDLTTDKLIGCKAGLSLVRKLMFEVIAACRPLGVDINLSAPEEKIRYTQTMGAYKSSMQIDRQMGRPMEVEAIFGNPLRHARKESVPTPCLGILYETLCAIDESIPKKGSTP